MSYAHTSPLRVRFLGTGTSVGVPMVACDCEVCTSPDSKDKRLRSSVLIESGNTTVLIDAGPDLRSQLLTHKIGAVDALLMTHHHKDHIGGLDDMRPLTFEHGPVDLFATETVKEAVMREIPYTFGPGTQNIGPKFNIHTITKDDSFQVGELTFLPIEVWHKDIKILGYRVGNFTYITDCSAIDESEKLKIAGSSHLVINGIRWNPHPSHFTITQAISLAQELKMPNTYITHISHQLGTYNEVTAKLPNDIYLAYDGLILDV